MMIRDGSGSGGRRRVRGDTSKTPYVDTGWEGYEPAEPAAPTPLEADPETGAGLSVDRESRRNYKGSRSGSPGSILRFLLFAGILGGLVLSGLYFGVRPAVLHAIGEWAAENPTALKLPLVPDIVRSELGASLTEPVNAADHREVVFFITEGQTPADIAAALEQADLITDPRAFVFESIQRDVSANFISGRHVLSKAMTVDQIIDVLTSPPVSPRTVHLVFREGLRIEQMVAELEYKEAHPDDPNVVLKVDVQDYYDLLTDPPPDLIAQYQWLKLPIGATLEGFLFPATYDVDPNITARQLVDLQLNAFAQNAPEALLKMPLDQIYKTVQIASLVELEATLDSDRPLVAGVYVNRLDKKRWPTGLLDADPTVEYGIDSAWLTSHSMADWVDYTFWLPPKGTTPFSQIPLPPGAAQYNTYKYGGLPPTPICSPGGASLEAAVAPDTTNGYFYFLSKNDGSNSLAFARTQAEQIANEKKYGYIK